ncbi:hypothetical protein J5Y04_16915 [Kitasatospora sp. RG8]|uniref:hypothetical protein n=1 Tax=Kitasatospora sp. RG8 TaxID=2820815 RepID=UPI001ADF8AE0|nr:hypothetical protein [Kitasatospora sp. RG8]MBP0451210.1 hypothetical protein [Kitasatospora sp. RG8]
MQKGLGGDTGEAAVGGVGPLAGLAGGLAGAVGDVATVAFGAQRVLEGGVVVGVVALRTGLGRVVTHALPLGQGGGRGGNARLVPGVGVPVGGAEVYRARRRARRMFARVIPTARRRTPLRSSEHF